MNPPFAAVLWDLDGVIVDTGELHYQAWKQTLEKFHIPFNRKMFGRVFGMHNKASLILLLGEERYREIGEAISDEKEKLFRTMLRGHVILLPGVADWLKSLQRLRIPCAVASSAPVENIDLVLDEGSIRGYFQAIVSGVGHPGKPDPWVFQEAARQLGVDASGCLVIEDSTAGVEAATRGGMRCLAVTTTHPADVLLATGAFHAVRSLSDLQPDEV